MTVPVWRRSARLGVIDADVAVVGGGIAGVSAALHLQDAGVACVLIERHALGAGASSRNAGFLMRGAADNYALACTHHGRGTARLLWRWTEDNLAMLVARGVDRAPSFARRGSCLLALENGELDELKRSHAMLLEDGFESVWLARHDDSAWRSGAALGGLVNPGDAVVNPVESLGVLASQLRSPVLEHQEVAEIRPAGEGVELLLPDAVVHGRRAVVCLNAYAPRLLPGFDRWVRPNRGQMLALEAPEPVLRLDFSYYANRGGEYFRRADDRTVVVGGKRAMFADDERTTDDRATDQVQGALEAFVRELFGVLPPVKSRWAGIMAFTPDHLPIIGPAPGFDGRVWFCGGFTGHGASLGHRCALAAVRGMMGDPGAVPEAFSTSRLSSV